MTEQELQREILDMWDDMRDSGRMVVDAPSRKIGTPGAQPYEGVGFPVEIDGVFVFVTIPAEKVPSFAQALMKEAQASVAMDRVLDAEIDAHDAISNAKGE